MDSKRDPDQHLGSTTRVFLDDHICPSRSVFSSSSRQTTLPPGLGDLKVPNAGLGKTRRRAVRGAGSEAKIYALYGATLVLGEKIAMPGRIKAIELVRAGGRACTPSRGPVGCANVGL